jgi:fructuronate reductase
MSCDNIPANGELLGGVVRAMAEARGDALLLRWIERNVAFPSTMVDRIVPATARADIEAVKRDYGYADAAVVVGEPFRQWVIEDRFTAGRPSWEAHGVTMVRDVAPFEEMKLRLLNGAHSATAYLGLLLGRETVSEAFGDSRIRGFVNGLWAEAIPTLKSVAGLDPQAYTAELAQRFGNPSLVHRTAQIATDGSQKLPQRIVASAISQLQAGRPADHLALALAAWMAALEARGRTLPAGHFTDPLDARLAEIASQRMTATDTVNTVFDLAGFAKDSINRDKLKDLVARYLETIRDRSMEAALAQLTAQEAIP